MLLFMPYISGILKFNFSMNDFIGYGAYGDEFQEALNIKKPNYEYRHKFSTGNINHYNTL